jgi:putative membrane protein
MSLFSAARRAFYSPAWPKALLGLFAAWFALWAVHPPHPQDFVLEHILTLLFVILLCWSYRQFRLSNVSYTAIFAFMALHVVGAHYTYSEVPYREWFPGLFDSDRNHYDRLVHFSFGLTMAYPVRELFMRVARARGFWAYYLPLDVVMSLSMLYELLEWAIAVIVGGDVGQSYLGTQGDEWDAHKDMALATLGGLVTITITALVNWRCNRDFAADLAASLQASDPEPLGEVRLRQLRDQPPRN